MELKEYIQLLVQAPIAVILFVFMYKVLQLHKDMLTIYREIFDKLLTVIKKQEKK